MVLVAQERPVIRRKLPLDAGDVERLAHQLHRVPALPMTHRRGQGGDLRDALREAIRRLEAIDGRERPYELRRRTDVFRRTGAMPARRLGGETQPERHLLLHLDAPDHHAVDRGLVRPTFVEHEADVGEELRLALQELLHAGQAAALFIGNGEEDDVAAERRPSALQVEQRHHVRDRDRLVVDRAAAPDVAPFPLAAERRVAPPLRVGRDDVDVAEEQQRLASGVGADQLRGDAVLRQEVAEIRRAGRLFAAGGVDAEVGDERLLRFPLDRVRRNAFRPAALQRGHRHEDREQGRAAGDQAVPATGCGIVSCTAGFSSGSARYDSKQCRQRASYEASPTSTCAFPPERRCE
jgi:hypothetical protein